MKIMKLNGCTENYKGSTYDWVCGEVKFNLIYDEDGDLYGIDVEGIAEKTLDKIIYIYQIYITQVYTQLFIYTHHTYNMYTQRETERDQYSLYVERLSINKYK